MKSTLSHKDYNHIFYLGAMQPYRVTVCMRPEHLENFNFPVSRGVFFDVKKPPCPECTALIQAHNVKEYEKEAALSGSIRRVAMEVEKKDPFMDFFDKYWPFIVIVSIVLFVVAIMNANF